MKAGNKHSQVDKLFNILSELTYSDSLFCSMCDIAKVSQDFNCIPKKSSFSDSYSFVQCLMYLSELSVEYCLKRKTVEVKYKRSSTKLT